MQQKLRQINTHKNCNNWKKSIYSKIATNIETKSKTHKNCKNCNKITHTHTHKITKAETNQHTQKLQKKPQQNQRTQKHKSEQQSQNTEINCSVNSEKLTNRKGGIIFFLKKTQKQKNTTRTDGHNTNQVLTNNSK